MVKPEDVGLRLRVESSRGYSKGVEFRVEGLGLKRA